MDAHARIGYESRMRLCAVRLWVGVAFALPPWTRNEARYALVVRCSQGVVSAHALLLLTSQTLDCCVLPGPCAPRNNARAASVSHTLHRQSYHSLMLTQCKSCGQTCFAAPGSARLLRSLATLLKTVEHLERRATDREQ